MSTAQHRYQHHAAQLDDQIGISRSAPWLATDDVDEFNHADTGPEVLQIDPLAALVRFAVTDEQVEEMEATTIIWGGVIPDQHIIVINAPGNGGKTTIATFIAGELARAGHKVMFFQEDAGAGDIPAMFEHARENGYQLLNSTLTQSTPEEQLALLRSFVKGGVDLRGFVLFFDTLKKYADLMSKGGSRAFFSLMRGLTQRGATIVLLGHTNKHVGLDGKLIFEGVADVRNDVDELFYIESTKPDAFNRVLLTMTPDKQRSHVKPLTFELCIDDRKLRVLERPVNVREIQRLEAQREEDEPINQAIGQAICRTGMNRTELVDLVAGQTGHGVKAVRRVLDRHCTTDPGSTTALWLETRLRMNNTRHVATHPNAPPLSKCQTAKAAEHAKPAKPTG